MTSVSATGYTPYYPTTTSTAAAKTAATSTGTGGSSSGSATNVTLSDAAKAAMSQIDFSTVIQQTRAAMDALLADGTKPADADLSKLDRRQLFAMATNAGGQFTPDEMAAAQTQQQNLQDAALAGPLAVARVTDDIEGIYKAASDFLDGASTEEKATAAWTTKKDAIVEAQKELAADPTKTPDVPGDIVADYIRRTDSGDTGTTRAIGGVASDARAALDVQYASAKAAGKTLAFSSTRSSTTTQLVDFSKFDSRSLASVALNTDNQFSAEEVTAAKAAMHSRSSATVLAGLQNAGSDPASFAKNLISAYASMSPEERQAAGWSEQLYSAAVASYNSASQLANIFGSGSAASSGASSLLGGSATGSSSGGMSLLDYLQPAS